MFFGLIKTPKERMLDLMTIKDPLARDWVSKPDNRHELITYLLELTTVQMLLEFMKALDKHRPGESIQFITQLMEKYDEQESLQ